MLRVLSLALLIPLAACGVETASTAAVAAKAAEENIRQGQQTQEVVLDRLDAAARLEQQRLDEAANAAK